MGALLECGEGLLDDLGGRKAVDLEVTLEVVRVQAMEGLQIDGARAVDEAIEGFGEIEFGDIFRIEPLGPDAEGGERTGVPDGSRYGPPIGD